MFRKRRGMSLTKLVGVILFVIGFCIFLYIMPFKIWIFAFAFVCMVVGTLIYHF